MTFSSFFEGRGTAFKLAKFAHNCFGSNSVILITFGINYFFKILFLFTTHTTRTKTNNLY